MTFDSMKGRKKMAQAAAFSSCYLSIQQKHVHQQHRRPLTKYLLIAVLLLSISAYCSVLPIAKIRMELTTTATIKSLAKTATINNTNLTAKSAPGTNAGRSGDDERIPSASSSHSSYPHNVEGWWSNYTSKIARAFVPWNHNHPGIIGTNNNDDDPYGWCIPEKVNQPTHKWRLQESPEGKEIAIGILYVKLYKASSSTCEGISINIAHNVAKRIKGDVYSNTHTQEPTPPCIHYNRHVFADLNGHSRSYRSYPNSLLWTFVRNPYKRSLSHIYHFDVSREKSFSSSEQITPRAIIAKLEDYKNFQTNYLLPYGGVKDKDELWKSKRNNNNNKAKKAASMRQVENVADKLQNDIINYYDFIGVTERMNESLAVMILLWKLHVKDVIVLDAKRSGGYDDGGHQNTCIKIQKPSKNITSSSIIEQYVHGNGGGARSKLGISSGSDENDGDGNNKRANNGKSSSLSFSDFNADILLHDAVNMSLDLTINKLGKSNVERIVSLIEELQTVAESKCQQQAIFPCSPDGTIQKLKAKDSCYVQDAGCGHECVTQALDEYISNHPTPLIFIP